MKLLFTADIHIKLGQKNVPLDWAKNRFINFVNQLDEIQPEVDIIVIGGDVFDKLPNMEELDLYFKMVKTFVKPTYIIDGNHEATKKGSTFLSQLKFVTNTINPLVNIIDNYWCLKQCDVDIIPYCKLKEFEKDPVQFHGKILVTHVRGEIPPHVKPEVDLTIFEPWKVVLAGDLHSYENSQGNILYPGSPYTTSFHRNLVDTGVIIMDTDTLTHEWRKLDLPQLLKKTITVGEEMVADPVHHVMYEVEGDLAELSNLEDHELLDKKVVKRESEATLILDPKLSLEEEVAEYLEFILQLSPKAIEAALKELNNYADKFS